MPDLPVLINKNLPVNITCKLYDVDALKTIDDFREWGIDIKAVVITRYQNQSPARAFKNKLELRGVKVYLHYPYKRISFKC